MGSFCRVRPVPPAEGMVGLFRRVRPALPGEGMVGLFRRPPSLTAESTWSTLATPGPPAPPVEVFDPATVADLPPPAARWLLRVLPAGTPLIRAVELDMTGEIRLGPRWFRFTAEQILRAGAGFVWRPTVGGRIVRFEGVDVLGPDESRMEFRLHGRIPVVRAEGEEVFRSACGRLAAETVSWLPQAAAPQAGARWTALDHDRAAVAVATPGGPVEVEVTVAGDGTLVSVLLQRWKDSADPPRYAPFGGDVTDELVTARGVRIAGAGTVGWERGTPEQAAAEFFRYRIGAVRPIPG